MMDKLKVSLRRSLNKYLGDVWMGNDVDSVVF